MDKIFAPIKSRVVQYLEEQGVVKEEFYKKIELNPSNFKGKGLKSELGGELIAKILTLYPDLNPTWLLLGEGDMTKAIGADSGEDEIDSLVRIITRLSKKGNNNAKTKEKIFILNQALLDLINEYRKAPK